MPALAGYSSCCAVADVLPTAAHLSSLAATVESSPSPQSPTHANTTHSLWVIAGPEIGTTRHHNGVKVFGGSSQGDEREWMGVGESSPGMTLRLLSDSSGWLSCRCSQPGLAHPLLALPFVSLPDLHSLLSDLSCTSLDHLPNHLPVATSFYLRVHFWRHGKQRHSHSCNFVARRNK